MPIVPIILALGAVGLVLLLVWGPLREKMAKQDLIASCNALRARLGVLRTQGGSTDEQSQLQAQLDDCQAAMRELGMEDIYPSEDVQLHAAIAKETIFTENILRAHSIPDGRRVQESERYRDFVKSP